MEYKEADCVSRWIQLHIKTDDYTVKAAPSESLSDLSQLSLLLL